MARGETYDVMLWTPILRFACWKYRAWLADMDLILMVLRSGQRFEAAKTVLLKDARMKVGRYIYGFATGT